MPTLDITVVELEEMCRTERQHEESNQEERDRLFRKVQLRLQEQLRYVPKALTPPASACHAHSSVTDPQRMHSVGQRTSPRRSNLFVRTAAPAVVAKTTLKTVE